MTVQPSNNSLSRASPLLALQSAGTAAGTVPPPSRRQPAAQPGHQRQASRYSMCTEQYSSTVQTAAGTTAHNYCEYSTVVLHRLQLAQIFTHSAQTSDV